jgi:predicted DNA-binding transcriptional regulator YafY
MLLQTRGRVTAAEVARELEVSERTARRDLEALGIAGVPVYSSQGRNGGWRLVGGARTDLSGLTASEARALFLVAGPSSAATPELKAALRKLVRALPEPFRSSAEAASTAVVVDPSDWGRRAYRRPAPAHLEAVQKAVVDGEQIVLGYIARDRSATERVVHPLGLATKRATWYLVADTDRGLRTFRVDRVTSVEPTGDPVVRPDGFDLEESWRLVTERVEREWTAHARGTADPEIVPTLRMVFGTRIRIGPPQTDGRVEVELGGWNEIELAGQLAGFGNAVEVLDPPALRQRLARLGAELTATYA